MKKVLCFAFGFILALVGICLVYALIPHPVSLGEQGIVCLATVFIMFGGVLISRQL